MKNEPNPPESTELADSKPTAIQTMAERLQVSQGKLVQVLKATAFATCRNDDEFAAMLIVANEYRLNPLLKEIYAFPSRNGVVPIVSIDGWLRLINSHPKMNGMDEEFADDGSWCRITIHRKDRDHPTVHTEFLEEVQRPTDPWKQHPRRMLKWKTIIQAGRIAFGLGGIYDEDEGRAVAGEPLPVAKTTAIEEPKRPAKNPFEDEVIIDSEAFEAEVEEEVTHA